MLREQLVDEFQRVGVAQNAQVIGIDTERSSGSSLGLAAQLRGKRHDAIAACPGETRTPVGEEQVVRQLLEIDPVEARQKVAARSQVIPTRHDNGRILGAGPR